MAALDPPEGERMQMSRHIGVIGLGYVGLPVATSFGAKGWAVTGFDIDRRRIAELTAGHDRTGEVGAEELARAGVHYTADPADLDAVDFFIVTVPTPIDDANRPDLAPLLSASRTVARALRPGAIVVYESTVYPGATEEECVPLLEAGSGLKAGIDFFVGYSPERINPGDPAHRFDTILKVVSAQTPEALGVVAAVYGSVVAAGIHKANSIRIAEAAKVIENTQRDLNIAFVNELAKIFRVLGLDTNEVLEAAGTKWNFLPFRPGLVGGHCIGVDPFYLTYRAERAGYHPEVILAGRRTNDGMGAYVARECIRLLMRRRSAGRRVVVLGLTFKENVPDIRNSKVVDVVNELRRFDIEVQVTDPLADAEEVRHEFDIHLVPLDRLQPADAVILAVPHRSFKERGWELVLDTLVERSGVVLDVKGILDRGQAPRGVELWRL
jgi:UDP-N-acetyl-D-galactosamine dehydrogenase